jgi:hypothetical protein
VLSWLRMVITDKYPMLVGYMDYCKETLQFKPNTIKNHVGNIKSACQWYTYDLDMEHRLPSGSLDALTFVVDKIRRAESLRLKRTKSRVTYEDKILDRTMPVGGLASLRKTVMNYLPWTEDVCRKGISKVDYQMFMSILFAALYVTAAQGRQGGIASLVLKEGQKMLLQGFGTTDKFKTAHKFQLQPVVLSAETHRLLTLYLERVRPQVETSTDPADPLWLTYQGKHEKHPGKGVSRFFKATMQLSINSTSIRDLVETAVHRLHVQGVISNEARTAVMNINGHSGQTAKDFYIQNTKFDEVRHAQVAFKAMEMYDAMDTSLESEESVAGGDGYVPLAPAPLHVPYLPLPAPLDITNLPLPVPLSATTLPLPAPVPVLALPLPAPLPQPPAQVAPAHVHPLSLALPSLQAAPTLDYNLLLAQWEGGDNFAAANWGSGRADYGIVTTRADWTNTEIMYVGRYCEDEIQRRGIKAGNVVAHCLRHIKRDPIALPIFHHLHVLDCSRLRHAWRIWPKLKSELLANQPQYQQD